jgi:hypothetical protein
MSDKIKKNIKLHFKTSNCCLICEEQTTNGFVLHKTRRQTHSMCNDCGVSYLTPLIKQATNNLRKNIRLNSSIIKCPGSINGEHRNICDKKVDIRSIKVSSSSELYTDIFRISFVLSNPNIYVCPNKDCGDIVETVEGEPNSSTTCQSCNTNWCKVCNVSPFHEGISCIEHEASQNNTENGKYIWNLKQEGVLKFCPMCRSPTLKRDGCNKMHCSICNVKWCWICKALAISYDHYNVNSKTPCSNRLWEGVDI